jgi:hypothetical protein
MAADAVSTVEVNDSLSVLNLDEPALQKIAADANPALASIVAE